MNSYNHPGCRAGQRYGFEAEQAARRHDLSQKHHFNRLAAINTAEGARAAVDEADRGILWSSAVAYAYHANDSSLLDQLCVEALKARIDDPMKAQILDMLTDPLPTLETNSQASLLTQMSSVVPFRGFRAKRSALKERLAA